MTLSGSLGFVPLDEVLRLLTRAGNDGMVQITNSNADGRIYVAEKGVSLALTLTDEALRDHLASSGYITAEDLEKVASGDARINDFLPEGSEGMALLREITVESIYQLDADDSDFQVVKDATTPFASSTPFDLEAILGDSRDRADQWAKVRNTISDLSATLTINRDLDSETIELDRESWRMVSEIGTGASVVELARRLGTTEFSVARVAVRMKNNNLLHLDSPTESVEAVGSDHESVDDYQLTEVAQSTDDHDRSWWEDTEDETSAESADDVVPVAETEDEHEPVSLDETVDGIVDDETEDTEAFLEKVFSKIGTEAEAADDGHGLMRRRRMGSILRDLGEE